MRRMSWPGQKFLLLFALAASLRADSGPNPPCGAEPVPPYPAPDRPPAVRVWIGSDLGRTWVPAACTGWNTTGFSTLVVTAAQFHQPGGVDALRRRLGAISSMKGIAYWSTNYKQWQTLILDAYAVQGPDGERRPDFAADEAVPGRTLYFQQEDNVFGKAIYRASVRTVSPARLVFETENVSPIRYLMLPLLDTGDAQAIYFFDRDSKDVWRYYSMVRTSRNAAGFALAAGHEASLINRAVAFYRHLAGIPTNREPPVAR